MERSQRPGAGSIYRTLLWATQPLGSILLDGSGKDDKSLKHTSFCLMKLKVNASSLGECGPADRTLSEKQEGLRKFQFSYTGQNSTFLTGL